MRPKQPPAERFWKKVAKGSDSDCWEWTAYKERGGYGTFYDGYPVMAHRWSYEQARGPIPPGLTLDHKCRSRSCVNPAHLEIVTGKENTLRGFGPSAANARKTVCKYGHPLTDGNFYRHKRGARLCKECIRIRNRAYLAARKTKPRSQDRTHCPQGHPYEGENLLLRGNGRRTCRTCGRARAKQWKAGHHQRKRTHCPAGHPFPSTDASEPCRICERARCRRWKEDHLDRTVCPAGHSLTGDNVHLYNNGKSRGCRTCEAERAAKRVRPTQCPSGHPLSGDNLYTSPDGLRFCRICGRERTRRWSERRRTTLA